MEPDRLLASHHAADQPVIDRVDTLLWQILRHEAERVHASGEREGCQLGKTKIQKPATEHDEGNEVAAPDIGTKPRIICSLVVARLQTNELITGA